MCNIELSKHLARSILTFEWTTLCKLFESTGQASSVDNHYWCTDDWSTINLDKVKNVLVRIIELMVIFASNLNVNPLASNRMPWLHIASTCWPKRIQWPTTARLPPRERSQTPENPKFWQSRFSHRLFPILAFVFALAVVVLLHSLGRWELRSAFSSPSFHHWISRCTFIRTGGHHSLRVLSYKGRWSSSKLEHHSRLVNGACGQAVWVNAVPE